MPRGPITLRAVLERFATKYVVAESGCWLWLRLRLPHKVQPESRWYGRYNVLGERLAHRVSYIIHKGPIPDDMEVCHTCDNPPCVNPEHFFLGTQLDNLQDMVAKGRQRNGVSIGEAHGRAVLTDVVVLEIRRRVADEGPNALGREFGVSKTQIMRIRDGKAWRHVL